MGAGSLHTAVQIVAAGLDVALAPRLSVAAHIARGPDIPLPPLAAPASREIGLAWRRTSLRAEELGLPASTLGESAALSRPSAGPNPTFTRYLVAGRIPKRNAEREVAGKPALCALPNAAARVFATGGFVKELRIHGTETEALASVAG